MEGSALRFSCNLLKAASSLCGDNTWPATKWRNPTTHYAYSCFRATSRDESKTERVLNFDTSLLYAQTNFSVEVNNPGNCGRDQGDFWMEFEEQHFPK
jgi:3',5'-cyclic AMP phosphodiesterase CpdA